MKANAHFRFLGLSEKQSAQLRDEFPSVEVDRHSRTGMLVGTIELNDVNTVVKIAEFKRAQKIAAFECDVYISILSDKRDETWRAPKLVNYVVNIVNCPIVFTYTC